MATFSATMFDHVLPLYSKFSAYLNDRTDSESRTAMYCDPTHLSKRGNRLVAERLYALIQHIHANEPATD